MLRHALLRGARLSATAFPTTAPVSSRALFSRGFSVAARAPVVPFVAGRRQLSDAPAAPAASVPVPLPASDAVVDATLTPMLTDVVARGDLASLGLASIYTPVGWIQNALEVLHVSAGLSWAGSVVALTVGIRFFLLPLVVKQMKTAARLADMKPELEQIQAESRRAYESGDATQMNMIQTKIAGLYRKHQVNPLSMLMPALAQMPVFVSAFMGLRKLSELHLDSFAVTGGPLSLFVDNLADPSMAFVAINTALFLAAFEIGADTGQQKMEPKMKNIMRVVITASGIFTYQLPTLVLVYWMASSSFSLAQAGALRYIAPLRAALGIPPVPKHDSQGTHALCALLFILTAMVQHPA